MHTHAKDGIKCRTCDPEVVYAVTKLPEDIVESDSDPYREMPLGKGSVPFASYLKALEDIGYRGFLTIEREVGANPVGDIGLAQKHLLDCMKV